MVGAVFLSEGIQKFVYPDDLGPGRFAAIGFSHPDLLASVVGAIEITAGLLILLGWLTRLAGLATTAVMTGAIITTKIPILLGRDLGPFHVHTLETYGFLSMAHEARTDYAMLLGSLFLILVGAGPWSVDAMLHRSPKAGRGR